ncbi:MAG: SDR family oxidoreductase [Alphaproteobacteria bacterium]|jgi:NAD(P)-dependent dehydrogenase (short-subunit alcohol dehydrogenase family)|nr:SDR family oxidoreductase [Alphaproteobacteria bacterium]
MQDVIVLIGCGSIGQAIVRRVAQGRKILLADLHQKNIDNASKTLKEAGFVVEAILCDVSSKESVVATATKAANMGKVMGVVHAAGVSPSQASIETILSVDLYGTALILEEFGKVIACGGNGIVISSQSGHRLPALSQEEDKALATSPAEELLNLPMLKDIKDTLHAYQISKRGNGLRVMSESVKWGQRGARVNAISPGIIYTPLANDELNGINADFYKNMLSALPVGRGGTPDEVAALASLIMSSEGGYITGSDFLIDGGATANYKFK